MRDINRIDKFLVEFGEIWKNKFPDWRFGQILYNFLSEYGDPFYLEEDEFIEEFKLFADSKKRGKD